VSQMNPAHTDGITGWSASVAFRLAPDLLNISLPGIISPIQFYKLTSNKLPKIQNLTVESYKPHSSLPFKQDFIAARTVLASSPGREYADSNELKNMKENLSKDGGKIAICKIKNSKNLNEGFKINGVLIHVDQPKISVIINFPGQNPFIAKIFSNLPLVISLKTNLNITQLAQSQSFHIICNGKIISPSLLPDESRIKNYNNLYFYGRLLGGVTESIVAYFFIVKDFPRKHNRLCLFWPIFKYIFLT